jgi:hypothetical protein
MMKSGIGVKGFVTVEMYEKGELIQRKEIRNLVTDLGKEFFAAKIFETPFDSDGFVGVEELPFIRDIGIGSGTAPPFTTDEELANQLERLPIIQESLVGNELTYFTEFIEEVGTGQINEVGLFTNDGVMVCRTLLQEPFTKTPERFINVSWRLVIG